MVEGAPAWTGTHFVTGSQRMMNNALPFSGAGKTRGWTQRASFLVTELHVIVIDTYNVLLQSGLLLPT